MSLGWQIFVLVLVIFGIVSNWLLLRWTSRYETTHQPSEGRNHRPCLGRRS